MNEPISGDTSDIDNLFCSLIYRYDYSCVIYGWDQRCTATEDWIYQMDVHLLPKKQHQPFYNVLVEDGSSRYAAEGLLARSIVCVCVCVIGRFDF